MNVTIFTDGSSRGNPGPGGWAAVSVYPDAHGKVFVAELGGREDETTNNRMEMTAALEVLKYFDGYYANQKEVTYTIYTDSAYLVNGVTKWMYGWSKNNWITGGKEEVKNQDIWEQFLTVVSQKKINWKIIKGHSGIVGNERCDVISTTFADDLSQDLYKGPLSEYSYQNILDVTTSSVSQGKKKSSSSKSAYSYISMVDGNIETHKTWADCEMRVKGAKGALFKKSLSLSDEQAIKADFLKRK